MRPYGWSDIQVTAGGGEIPPDTHLAVEIRTNAQSQNVLTIRQRRRREILFQRLDVVGVRSLSRSTYAVDFESWPTMEFTKPKNCGCGGAP